MGVKVGGAERHAATQRYIYELSATICTHNRAVQVNHGSIYAEDHAEHMHVFHSASKLMQQFVFVLIWNQPRIESRSLQLEQECSLHLP